jgi:predicted AlkP superfamily phosphohydrolase/phosphomutase
MESQSAQWFLSRGTLQARARSAPDLIVYFGALYWRSAGTVGGGHMFANDIGPDGANHAENGVLLLRPSGG